MGSPEIPRRFDLEKHPDHRVSSRREAQPSTLATASSLEPSKKDIAIDEDQSFPCTDRAMPVLLGIKEGQG